MAIETLRPLLILCTWELGKATTLAFQNFHSDGSLPGLDLAFSFILRVRLSIRTYIPSLKILSNPFTCCFILGIPPQTGYPPLSLLHNGQGCTLRDIAHCTLNLVGVGTESRLELWSPLCR